MQYSKQLKGQNTITINENPNRNENGRDTNTLVSTRRTWEVLWYPFRGKFLLHSAQTPSIKNKEERLEGDGNDVLICPFTPGLLWGDSGEVTVSRGWNLIKLIRYTSSMRAQTYDSNWKKNRLNEYGTLFTNEFQAGTDSFRKRFDNKWLADTGESILFDRIIKVAITVNCHVFHMWFTCEVPKHMWITELICLFYMWFCICEIPHIKFHMCNFTCDFSHVKRFTRVKFLM